MGLRDASLALLIALACAAPARRDVSAFAAQRSDAAARVRDYVLTWQQALAAVVAEERYTQTLTQFPDGRHTRSGENKRTTRTLVSDVLLVHAPAENAWLMFRDVISFDGTAVRDRQRRFDDLFVRPDANLVASARRIADEGARYNLGMFRNVNTPATALVFLDDSYQSSVTWRKPGRASIEGRDLLTLDFEQKRAPFAIRSPDGDPRPATGTFWVEPGSSRIVRTLVELKELKLVMSRRGQVELRSLVRVSADFGEVAGVDPWVPLRMTDEYDMYGGIDERLMAEATYTNHRLFRTGARIIGEGR